MIYTRTTWVDGVTPVDASRLNNLESGIIGKKTLMTFGNTKMRSIISNGEFARSTTGWSGVDAVVSWIAEKTATAQYQSMSNTIANPTTYRSHKVYMGAWVKAASSGVALTISDGVSTATKAHSGSNAYEWLSAIRTVDAAAAALYARIQDNRASGWNKYYAHHVIMIDLTADFGAGSEPTAAYMDEYLSTLPNYWFNGSNGIIPGVWTPDLQFGGAKVGITYSTQSGEYTQVGTLITATGIIILTSKGSSVGNATIAGLPLPAKYYGTASMRCEDMEAAATGHMQGLIVPSYSYIRPEMFAAGVMTVLTNAHFKNTSILVFSASYHV